MGSPLLPLDLRERAPVVLGVRGMVAAIIFLVALAAGAGKVWASMSAQTDSTAQRVSAAESRIKTLEVTSSERAVQLQQLQDGVQHIRETTDQIAQDLRAEKRRHR